MDAVDIFERIDIYGKPPEDDLIRGECPSCRVEKPVVKGKGYCPACFSLVIAPSSQRFSGALYADPSHAIEWVKGVDFGHNGPDVDRRIRDDFLAAAFDYVYRLKVDEPYIFAVNTGKSVLSLENLRVNIDEDLIQISGPVSPVTSYRDRPLIRRSLIRKELENNLPRNRDDPEHLIPAWRYASVMDNLGLSGQSYKNAKGIKAWNL